LLLTAVTAILLAQASSGSATVPVVKCSYQTMSGAAKVSAPATVRAPIGAQWQSKIAYFSMGSAGVFAPRSWHCFAHAGTGAMVIGVAPPTTDSFPNDTAGKAGITSMVWYAYGGHFSLVLQKGTPLFANLRGIAFAELHGPNPSSYMKMQAVAMRYEPPKGEKVTIVSDTVVKFCDPPKVRGSGAGSGGAYPSCGIATEDWHNGATTQDSSQPAIPDLHIFSITMPQSDQQFMRELMKLNGA
jgi:hypothetical protein